MIWIPQKRRKEYFGLGVPHVYIGDASGFDVSSCAQVPFLRYSFSFCYFFHEEIKYRMDVEKKWGNAMTMITSIHRKKETLTHEILVFRLYLKNNNPEKTRSSNNNYKLVAFTDWCHLLVYIFSIHSLCKCDQCVVVDNALLPLPPHNGTVLAAARATQTLCARDFFFLCFSKKAK